MFTCRSHPPASTQYIFRPISHLDAILTIFFKLKFAFSSHIYEFTRSNARSPSSLSLLPQRCSHPEPCPNFVNSPRTRHFPDEFQRLVIKTDLHCHLDGCLRPQTLIDLANQQNVELPTYDAEQLNRDVFKETYESLEEYLVCFSYATAVLRSSDALEHVAYEQACDQYVLGVRYFETRFAPQLNAVPGELSLEQVLLSVNRGLKRATDEFNAKDEDVVSGLAP